ncbi:MFS transporter [Kocuria tytonicola]|uniref:MFS transporter n=1 Tax=Kocuria tytonicola TaxID=2055946 RepID=UPI000EF960A9|nr:MFS transporter [Kocuria tytonicola]RLZ03201.1 MFS transporter [Kocuria tytonicola]
MTHLTPARRRLALFALALGGFGIGCTEFASMGLLPQIAQSLLPELFGGSPETGIARAGWLVSAYAVGVVVGAPLISFLAARSSRTVMLLVMAAALMLGNLASALVPSFETLLAMRFLAGLPHGAYFGLASLVAATVMGPGNQAKGVALALSGLTVANVVGVPVMTAIGQAYGWRMAYAAVAVVFALTVLGLWLTVPHQPPHPAASHRGELLAFARPQVWIVMGVAAVGFGGFFAIYTYLSQMGRELARLPAGAIPWLLAVVGVGMTIGNVIGGISADRSARRTMAVGFPALAAALLLMGALAGSPVGIFVAGFVMSLVNSYIMPSIQSWLITAAGPAELMGASLNHAAFNVANSIGALLGGTVISAGFGYRSPALVACVLAVAGALLALAGVHRQKLDRRRRLASGHPVTASQTAV